MDEMKHYEKIAERLNYLGVVPTTQPDPIAHSKTTKAMIKDGVEEDTKEIPSRYCVTHTWVSLHI